MEAKMTGISASTAKGFGGSVRRVAMALLVMMLTATTAWAGDVVLTNGSDFVVLDGEVVTGSTNGKVTIAEGASITLSNVTIGGGITCDGTATITLVGTNSVMGTDAHGAAILIGGAGTTLTIQGDGSLTAAGYSGHGAGIGLDLLNHTGGNIVIKGGTVTATGYDGIGKGNGILVENAIGTITIYNTVTKVDASSISKAVTYMYGETDVTANAADYFNIVEDGNRHIITPLSVVTLSDSNNYTAQDGDVLIGSTNGKVTIADGASITLRDVTIGGGITCDGTATVTLVGTNSVTGAYLKAGIQVGGSGTTLTIRGNGSLTAKGGLDSAGIGLSRAWNVDATGGDIVIEGGNITATGNDMGAGIGTGACFSDTQDKTATIGNITIKGGTVTAIGGTGDEYGYVFGDGIGKGYAYSSGHAVVGTINIYDTIDKVDASSISKAVTYIHVENGVETDVTAKASLYFDILVDGSRYIIHKTPDYSITIADNIEHGTLTGPTTAKYKERITMTATPFFANYGFSRLIVTDSQGNEVATEGNSFYMPQDNVTVSAEFLFGTVVMSGSGNYNVQDGDYLAGSTSGTVTIADGASITLSNVTIGSGITCDGTATITLVGNNSVTGAHEKAGIQVGGSGTTLTIRGDGSLTAKGGHRSAGIGLSSVWNATGGDIVIEGGNITAIGGAMDKIYPKGGAGIGTCVLFNNGSNFTLGSIIIKGGTVTATGESGIGAGSTYNNASYTIGSVKIYDTIDKVDASSISKAVTYIHVENGVETDVTAVATEYFNIEANEGHCVITPLPAVILYDSGASASGNATTIADNATTCKSVGLYGRTLWKDGKWNTLCLPFGLSAAQIAASPLAGADIRELIPSTSGLEGTTLMLNFTPAAPAEGAVTELVAGTPYLIKWDGNGTDNIVNPVFSNVTISSTTPESVTSGDGMVTFKGTYSPVDFTPNRSILYLGAENKLYYPNADMTLGACRAYFQLNDGIEANAFSLNFDDDGDNGETTGIVEMSDVRGMMSDAWYTLDGRKIANGHKLTAKGLYIQNGKKVVIK